MNSSITWLKVKINSPSARIRTHNSLIDVEFYVSLRVYSRSMARRPSPMFFFVRTVKGRMWMLFLSEWLQKSLTNVQSPAKAMRRSNFYLRSRVFRFHRLRHQGRLIRFPARTGRRTRLQEVACVRAIHGCNHCWKMRKKFDLIA